MLDPFHLASGTASLLLLVTSPAWTTDSPPEGPRSAAMRVLDRARAQNGELDPDWLEQRLLTSSAGSLERLAVALSGHTADCSAEEECVHLEPESSLRLRAALRDLALEVGARATQHAASTAERTELARHGLDLCALAGTEREMELVVALATPAEGAPVDEVLGARLQLAVSSILTRCPPAYAELEAALASMPLPILSRALAAVGSQDSPRALGLLPAFLDRDAKFDIAVMSHLSRLAARHPGVLDDSQIGSLRTRLWAVEAAVRRQAAEALGWLEDEQSVGPLLDLLIDESRGVQRSAHWALGRITGLTMEVGDPRWRTWHESELVWWEERAQAVRHDLASRSAEEVIAALHELSLHRLHATELAQWIEPLASDHRPAVASRACSALGAFGKRSSIASLLAALEHPDTRPRRAAHRALHEITAWELPPSPTDWRQAFQQGGPEGSPQDLRKSSR